MTAAERRAAGRTPVRLKGLGCLLGDDGHTVGEVFPVEVQEVGEGGARLSLRRSLEAGQSLHLICRLGDDRSAFLVGAVVWTRREPREAGGGHAAGFVFTPTRQPGTDRLMAHGREQAVSAG